MAKLDRFLEIYKMYREYVDFAIIYVEEAHPSGEWNMGVRYYIYIVLSINYTAK